ncbi:hypothetical protein AVEN_179122-1 [Araneus ventricosus]|uniref:Uncharacterized protein n=1 Tax=Araneus ventricosus TaxID=182803 RepID=A0A4Y2F3K9_ARAVE|nr:hypothetical protein AVEN_179122-1 [Araneus ventricosus]
MKESKTKSEWFGMICSVKLRFFLYDVNLMDKINFGPSQVHESVPVLSRLLVARRNGLSVRSTVRCVAETFHGKAPRLVRAEPDRVSSASLAESRCSATAALDPIPTNRALKANTCPEVLMELVHFPYFHCSID